MIIVIVSIFRTLSGTSSADHLPSDLLLASSQSVSQMNWGRKKKIKTSADKEIPKGARCSTREIMGLVSLTLLNN